MSDDLTDLDPGIRRTVGLLRAWGFETTDSGDGESKRDMPCAVDRPHVHCVVDPARMVAEAHRLHDIIGAHVNMSEGERSVEASYSPADGIAVLSLWGVADWDWHVDAARERKEADHV